MILDTLARGVSQEGKLKPEKLSLMLSLGNAMPDYIRMVPLEQFTTLDGNFVYHTFFCCIADEFAPILNHEHLGYAWIDSMSWPKPMHPGLWNTVNFDAVRGKIESIKTSVQISQ